MIGLRFDRWTIIGEPTSGKAGTGILRMCRCDCGTERAVQQRKLLCGLSTSCGCNRIKHGRGESLEYKSWTAMLSRCRDEGATSYECYGGRGIGVCTRWYKFKDFYADMGPRPSIKHTIERIDNNGNYEPGNCRWATRKEQANNRSTGHFLTFNGMTKTITEWASELGVCPDTLFYREKIGLPPEQVLNPHVRGRR